MAGVVARGNRLVVRFTRPVADFPAQTTMPFFCAVPPTLPADPEGVGAFPGAGPYYVAEYRPGQRVVIRRNRFYRGTRPHHVNGFDVDLTPVGHAPGGRRPDRARRGRLGLGPADLLLRAGRRLVAKYGVNRSQFFVKPGLRLFGFSLNTSRPLFRDNPRLRRAVNFAIDRRALARTLGGPQFATPTDQYLPPGMPGIQGRSHLPVHARSREGASTRSRPHPRREGRPLHAGRSGSASRAHRSSLRTWRRSGSTWRSRGSHPPGTAIGCALDEPFDIAFFGWVADYLDPFTYINVLLDGRYIGSTNCGRFDSAEVQRLHEARRPPARGMRASGPTSSSTSGSPVTRHRGSPSIFRRRQRSSRGASDASCCDRSSI